jgi:biotin carboxylase
VLLLLPSATYRAGDFLDAARALEVDVIIGTEEAHVLQGLMGEKALEVPLRDMDAAVDAVVAQDGITALDAVISVDDAGTVVAAQASARLGLVHNPPDAVAAARDKLEMRARLHAAEVPQPVFAHLPADVTSQAVEELARHLGLPCVVKPASLSGSQGVIRVDTPADAAAAARRVRAIANSAGVDAGAPLLIESYVPGDEVALEGLLVDEELVTLAVFDKPDPLEGPFFEESMYVTPSRLAGRDLAAVTTAAAAATRALGLRHGPVHAEVRVHNGRASVIEVAARTIGGLCSRALQFSSGRSLEQLVIAHALGRPLGGAETDSASGVLMIPIPGEGRLVAVEGQSEARAVPGITGIEITIAPGRPLVPLPEGNRYLGFVFARGVRPDRVEAALRRARSALHVHLETMDHPSSTRA